MVWADSNAGQNSPPKRAHIQQTRAIIFRRPQLATFDDAVFGVPALANRQTIRTRQRNNLPAE